MIGKTSVGKRTIGKKMMGKNDVLQFWFDDLKPAQHWRKDPKLDEQITKQFLTVHQAAIQCELYTWRETALGRLAEIIVLDQFSRNIYRDLPEAFAADSLALALAQEAIALGLHNALSKEQKSFLYMPFMHSESLLIHNAALTLFEENGVQSTLDFEIKHKKIIERFGRYPHRNAILGRLSTQQELSFLNEPGSSF